MLSTVDLELNTNFWQGEDQNRLQVLRLLLAGYSNNAIAQDLNFSLKNIESIISKLFRKLGIITKGAHSNLINPRVRLLVEGIRGNWVNYRIDQKPSRLDFLTRNQYLSLILCTVGCSNKAIAEFLSISSKTVESRLNSLFHLFNVNVQFEKQLNPRVRLITNSLVKSVITTNSIISADQIFNFENWNYTVSQRELIKEQLLKSQLEASRFQFLHPGMDMGTVLDHAQSLTLNQQGAQASFVNSSVVPENQQLYVGQVSPNQQQAYVFEHVSQPPLNFPSPNQYNSYANYPQHQFPYLPQAPLRSGQYNYPFPVNNYPSQQQSQINIPFSPHLAATKANMPPQNQALPFGRDGGFSPSEITQRQSHITNNKINQS